MFLLKKGSSLIIPVPLSSGLLGNNNAAVVDFEMGLDISIASPFFSFNFFTTSASILILPCPESSLKASFTLSLLSFPSIPLEISLIL